MLSSSLPSCCKSKRITFSSKVVVFAKSFTRFVYFSRVAAAAAAACCGEGFGVVGAGVVGAGVVGAGVVGAGVVGGGGCRGRNMGFR